MADNRWEMIKKLFLVTALFGLLAYGSGGDFAAVKRAITGTADRGADFATGGAFSAA